jgi:hypothetical protein
MTHDIAKEIEKDCWDKFKWMMDYCKSKEMPPAQAWAWDKAKIAYEDRPPANET